MGLTSSQIGSFLFWREKWILRTYIDTWWACEEPNSTDLALSQKCNILSFFQVKRSSLVDSRTSVTDVKFAPKHLGLQLVGSDTRKQVKSQFQMLRDLKCLVWFRKFATDKVTVVCFFQCKISCLKGRLTIFIFWCKWVKLTNVESPWPNL